MVNISELGNLQPVETIKLDSSYKSASTGFIMPQAGRYTVQSPESFQDSSFGATKAGNLSVTLDPTIVGPTNAGTKLRFVKVSAKPFPRDGGMVSQVADYLRAVGFTGEVPGDPQALADLVAQTGGAQYEAVIDWEARHAATNFTVKGMRNFPSDGNGGHQSWVNHPTEKDAEGKPLRLRANLVVARYIPRTI